jgi:hypothetical protein
LRQLLRAHQQAVAHAAEEVEATLLRQPPHAPRGVGRQQESLPSQPPTRTSELRKDAAKAEEEHVLPPRMG